jgi:hypothetical protein
MRDTLDCGGRKSSPVILVLLAATSAAPQIRTLLNALIHWGHK